MSFKLIDQKALEVNICFFSVWSINYSLLLCIGSVGLKFNDFLDPIVHEFLIACDERLYAAFRELDSDDSGFISDILVFWSLSFLFLKDILTETI